MVPGAAVDRLRHPRRHLARSAGRRAGPQRHDRLGLHHTNLDSQDLFIERVDPTEPNRYITPTAPAVHRARGDDQRRRASRSPCELRETRHGPVIDDFIRRGDDLTPRAKVLALQATALDGADTSAEGS